MQSRRNRPKLPSVFPLRWLRLSAGIFLVAVALQSLYDYSRFMSHAVHTSGTVVDVRTEAHRSGGRRGGNIVVQKPVVRFEDPTTHGVTTATARASDHTGTFNRGESLAVAFNPNDPQGSLRIDDGISWADTGAGVVGLLLVLWVARDAFALYRYRKEVVAWEHQALAS